MQDKDTQREDIELMQALQAGDERAFNQLSHKYAPRLINFIYRFTGNQADAEDIAQEVFLKVYRSREAYRPVAAFSSWIYAIATHACLDYKKFARKDIIHHSRPIGTVGEESEEHQADIADTHEKAVEAIVERQGADRVVQQTLIALPENQRIALILKEYEDRSYADIAEVLDCSVSSVESLIFRARQKLKTLLSAEK